ncbi:MAG: hypothetical protein WCK47_08755 [bacterium]|nr:hypothetical protein [Candidatus Sumerlaeota bacterium]
MTMFRAASYRRFFVAATFWVLQVVVAASIVYACHAAECNLAHDMSDSARVEQLFHDQLFPHGDAKSAGDSARCFTQAILAADIPIPADDFTAGVFRPPTHA